MSLLRNLVQRYGKALLPLATAMLSLGLVQWLDSGEMLNGALRNALDDYYYDVRVQLAGRRAPADNIVLAGLDDAVFQQNLFNRPTHARVIENLARAGAQVVFYDVLFDEPRDPAADERLVSAVAKSGIVVLARNLSRAAEGLPIPPILIPGLEQDIRERKASAGLINVSGETKRWATLALKVNAEGFQEEPYPSAALATLAWMRKLDPSDIVYGPSTINVNPLRIPVHSDTKEDLGVEVVRYRIPLAYHRRATGPGATPGPGTFPVVSYTRLLDPADPIFAKLRGATVIVGDNRTSESDLMETPVGKMKGFEVHAQILNTLLEGPWWHRNEPGAQQSDAAVAVILAFLVGWMMMLQNSIGRSLLVAVLGCAGGLVILLASTFLDHIWDAGLYLGVCAFTLPLCLLGRFLFTARFLETFIPKEVVDQLLRTGKAQEGDVVATVIVTDIRGYTTLSESKTPLQILTMLNEYHTETVGIYHRYHGNVLNYQGDAQIVLFGLPGQNLKDPAGNAVKAALETSQAVEDLRKRWGIADKANFDVGAGVCTGKVSVGELGGAAENTEYTVIGETVRKCHKVQSMSSALESNVLMDEETYKKITERTRQHLKLERVENVELEGITYPVTLYRTFEN